MGREKDKRRQAQQEAFLKQNTVRMSIASQQEKKKEAAGSAEEMARERELIEQQKKELEAERLSAEKRLASSAEGEEKMNSAVSELEKKLEQLQHREQQLQNRIRYLEGAERRLRNHRLITRGAAVEHLWPEVKALSEQDFYSLMELVLSLNVARKVLHSFLQSRPKEDDE